MPLKKKCPRCGGEVDVGKQKKNPRVCAGCGLRLLKVSRTCSMQVRFPETQEEQVNKALTAFSQIGQACLNAISLEFGAWDIIPTEKLLCANPLCGKRRPRSKKADKEPANKVTFLHRPTGKKFCASCAGSRIWGSEAREKLLPAITKHFLQEMPRKSLIENAWRIAAGLFEKKWIKDNWRRMAARNSQRKVFAERREAAGKDVAFRVAELSHGNVTEDRRITRIRALYAQNPRLQCPLEFWKWYCRGKDATKPIRKRNRVLRRKQLRTIPVCMEAYGSMKPLEEKERKEPRHHTSYNNLAYAMFAPMCASCEHLQRFNWGWNCKHEEGLRRVRLTRRPRFPTTVMQLTPNSYSISLTSQETENGDVYTGDVRISFMGNSGDGGGRRGFVAEGAIVSPGWVVKVYGKDILGDTTTMPTLLKRGGKWFFQFPITKVVPMREGEWTHVISFTPRATEVVSWDGEGKRRVKTWPHGNMLEVKRQSREHLQSPTTGVERRNLTIARKRLDQGKPFEVTLRGASPWFYEQMRKIGADVPDDLEYQKPRGYFDVPRGQSQLQLRDVLHQETAALVRYLELMPGRVLLLHMQKQQARRGETDRREINKRLSDWTDGSFRLLAGYKLELAGFQVDSLEFPVTADAVCSSCQTELGGSWQELVLRDQGHIKCGCGRELSLGFAMAIASQNQVYMKRAASTAEEEEEIEEESEE